MSTRKIVRNIRSSAVIDGKPKLPQPTDLDFGEIAINYAKGYETLSLKNDLGEIVSMPVNTIEDIKVNGSSVVSNKTAEITMKGNTIPVSGNQYDVTNYPSPFEDKAAHISATDKVDVALKKVETNISKLVTEVLDDEETFAAAIRKLANSAGTVDGSNNIMYIKATNAHYINNAESVHDATVKLDNEIYGLETRINESVQYATSKLDSEIYGLETRIGESEIEWVNLDLPSGILWAKCNLGAFTETENGDYYMWGSTTPDNNHACNWANAPFNDGSKTFNSTYFNTYKSEWMDSSNNLKPEFDAAYKATNGIARMPTNIEWDELINNTTGTSATINGVNGYKFTSKTDESKYIFIPITLLSCRINSAFTTYSNQSYFWSSTLSDSDSTAWIRNISNLGASKTYNKLYEGLHIRPVKDA